MKRNTQILVALMGVLLISFAVPAMAQAEQCSSDGKVCLVTDTSQPFVPPAQLEFRVASEASYLKVTDPTLEGGHILPNLALVEQGPPGGMSRWVGTMAPTEVDRTYSVEAVAQKPTSTNDDLEEVGRATFSVPSLGSVGNLWTRVVRKGKKYVGEVHYEGRTTITNQVTFLLGLNSDVVGHYLKDESKLITRPGEIGHEQVIRIVFTQADVKRKCKTYRYCKLLVQVKQYYSYVDEQGSKRTTLLALNPYTGQAGLVVHDRRKTCQKLLKKNKQAYRQRCAKEPPPKKVPDQESPGKKNP